MKFRSLNIQLDSYGHHSLSLYGKEQLEHSSKHLLLGSRKKLIEVSKDMRINT